jgi:hypothetical protein
MLASLASPHNTVRQMLASLASPRNTAWEMLASLASTRDIRKIRTRKISCQVAIAYI